MYKTTSWKKEAETRRNKVFGYSILSPNGNKRFKRYKKSAIKQPRCWGNKTWESNTNVEWEENGKEKMWRNAFRLQYIYLEYTKYEEYAKCLFMRHYGKGKKKLFWIRITGPLCCSFFLPLLSWPSFRPHRSPIKEFYGFFLLLYVNSIKDLFRIYTSGKIFILCFFFCWREKKWEGFYEINI